MVSNTYRRYRALALQNAGFDRFVDWTWAHRELCEREQNRLRLDSWKRRYFALECLTGVTRHGTGKRSTPPPPEDHDNVRGGV